MSASNCTQNGANGTQNGVAHSDALDGLLDRVRESVDIFKAQHREKDRLAALKTAQQLVQALHTPRDAVYHLVYSPTLPMCVRIAIDLELFTTLSRRNGPMPLAELAAVKNADPIITERVLRILAGIGYVAEHGGQVYSPTTMTHQMADRYSIATIKFIWDIGMPTVAKIPEFLRQHDYQRIEGATTGPFQYAEKTDKIMGLGGPARPSWVEWFPVGKQLVDGFSGNDEDVLLVDVAGGRGHDLKAFRDKFPHARGRMILEDLKQVLDQTLPDLEVEKLEFDLFKPQPIEGARIYYMKFILHDWSDDQCHEILQQIHQAMKPGYSKLIIEEFILPEKDCPMLPAMWDWEMMAFCNSMERSQDHWTRLLEGAGFEVQFWFPPGDGQGIIEAVPKAAQ